MSNIAGKAYAMNVITPIRWYMTWINKLIFRLALNFPKNLNGLVTLSLIHYARWTVIDRWKFPRLDPSQPKEDLHYSYMLFFSNFNGSWAQYVDSFSFAIPSGLDLFWKWNIRYPKSVPVSPFHDHIRHNQIDTTHYYNAYPLAASNDVKSAKELKAQLIDFKNQHMDDDLETFVDAYGDLLRSLQHDFGSMQPTPVVSMANMAAQERRRVDQVNKPKAAPAKKTTRTRKTASKGGKQ